MVAMRWLRGLIIGAAWLGLVAVASFVLLLVGVLMVSLMWALIEKMLGEVWLLADTSHRFDIHPMPLYDWLVVLIIVGFQHATLAAIVMIVITEPVCCRGMIQINANLMLL